METQPILDLLKPWFDKLPPELRRSVTGYAVSMKNWLGSLSPRARRVGAGAGLLLLAWFFVSVVGGWIHRSSPAYVLEIVDRIHSPQDVEYYNSYFTVQGKEIMLWALTLSNDKPSVETKPIFSEPVIYRDTCDIPARFTDVTGTVRLLKVGNWRFHDIYIDAYRGQPIAVWMSYFKDHPYRTWLKANWKGVAGSFMQGFMIGLRGGG